MVIHKDFLAELDNPDVGLTNVLPSDIYDHIIDTYAKIDLKMVDTDKAKFQEPIDPTEPLAVYTKK